MKRQNISEKLREKVRKLAQYRCGYCLFSEIYSPTIFQIDHIIPFSKGGTNDEANLWLLCETCNRAKSDKTEVFDPQTKSIVPIFNPRTQIWNEHFGWSDDFTRIIGKTPTGRGTVADLNLNRKRIVLVRRNWISVG
jgi:hypothetical protein